MNLKTILVIGLTTLMGCYLPPSEPAPRTEMRVIYIYESSAQSRYDYEFNARWQHVNPLYRPQRFTFEDAMRRSIQERHRRPEGKKEEPRQEHRRLEPTKKPDA